MHIIITDNESSQRYNALKLSSFVLDITGIDSLTIHPYLFNIVHCLSDCHITPETDIIWRHESAGTVFRIIKEGIYLFSLVPGRFFKDLVDQIGRQFFKNVYLIVKVKLIDYVIDLTVSDPVDYLDLVFC